MKRTDEQLCILAGQERRKTIQACAGTGKTTVLLWLAESNPGKRILYIVFTKSAQIAAKKVFPKTTIVKTIHALAFQYEGWKWKETLGYFGLSHLLPFFEDADDPQSLGSLTYQLLNYYLNVPYTNIRDCLDTFLPNLTENVKTLFEEEFPDVLKVADRILELWENKDLVCSHDWYLKQFHLSGQFQEVVDSYDLVLVDEFQDLSPIMLDVLQKSTTYICSVGDEFQQIFTFRHAVNAMALFETDAVYQLSQSFRFGSDLADVASLFVQETLHPDFVVKGLATKDTYVRQYEYFPTLYPEHAILSRTNVTLFANLVRLHQNRVPYRFERDPRMMHGYLSQVLDVHRLYQRLPEKIRNEFIRSFEDFEQLREYAEANEDIEWMGLINLVTQNLHVLPGIVFDVMKTLKQKPEPGAVWLSTIHAAKGREYERVILCSDIGYMLSIANGSFEEEARLAYVAMTRGMGDVSLPAKLGEVASQRWQDHFYALPGGN